MKSNELMLGNWVWFECDELHMTTSGRVINIRSDGSYAPGVNINGGIIYRVGLIDQWGNQRDEHIIDLEPIPLTPEWLERMGFEFDEDNDFGDEQFYLIRDSEGDCIVAIYHAKLDNKYFIELHPNAEIKYVHQLQNLYFALTGEELVIKPQI